MHLGNMFTALVSWLSAKSQGGTWLLRHEDLDTSRSRHEYARIIEDDLHWLGLDWDEGGMDSPETMQSRRGAIYHDVLERLCETGMVYPCYCTRSELLASQAPHQSDGRLVYSGRCRPEHLPLVANSLEKLKCDSEGKAWRTLRLGVPDRAFPFDDLVFGNCSYNLARDCGDFVLHRADGGWAYQLAVVADDALMGVTEVVRGNDLLLSTSQQLYLYELMGWKPPVYAHTPLLVNGNGQRLSKRDKSMGMEELRQRCSPESLTAYLANLMGLDVPEECTPQDLLPIFSLSLLKDKPVITV